PRVFEVVPALALSSPRFPFTTLFRSHVSALDLHRELLLEGVSVSDGDLDPLRRLLADRHVVLALDVRHDRLVHLVAADANALRVDRKSTRLNSSHASISYAVFCLMKK